MTDLAPSSALLLVIWGTLVGLDLVSVPQAMIARPVVAGAVAGWLAGDVDAGLRVGVLFELFALDVLPVGAVRYPDYGPATVAATALAADSPWQFALGQAAALGLAVAVLGGFSLQTGAARQRACHPAPLRGAGGRGERGDPAAAVRLACPGRDAGRRPHRPRPRLRVGPGALRMARPVHCARAHAGGRRLRALGRHRWRAAEGRAGARGCAGSAPVPWWDCSRRRCDERRMARLAAALRGAGNLELRADAGRRHGLRRGAACWRT